MRAMRALLKQIFVKTGKVKHQQTNIIQGEAKGNPKTGNGSDVTIELRHRSLCREWGLDSRLVLLTYKSRDQWQTKLHFLSSHMQIHLACRNVQTPNSYFTFTLLTYLIPRESKSW